MAMASPSSGQDHQVHQDHQKHRYHLPQDPSLDMDMLMLALTSGNRDIDIRLYRKGSDSEHMRDET